MPKQYALLSLPRSGSTWFWQQLQWPGRARDCNGEFFNPGTNRRHCANLCTMFGAHPPYEDNAALPSSAASARLEDAYHRSWKPAGFQSTKEVWACCKVPFFAGHFRCAALVRHRQYTFPGRENREWTDRWYDGLYRSFLHNILFLPVPVCRLLDRLKRQDCSPVERRVGTHILASYMLLYDCDKYSIPVVRYHCLTRLPQDELRDYLIGLNIPGVNAVDLAARVVKTRKTPDFLPSKVWAYKKYNVEPFCQEFLKLGGGLFEPFLEYLNPAEFCVADGR